MSENEDRRIAFSYWSDPLCIWAYVAQPKLERVLRDWGHCLEASYRILPVFGSVPWRFREGPWAEPGPAGRARATREIAEQFGHRDVSGQVWLDDPPASSWAAGAALGAVAELERREQIDAGRFAEYQWQMRRRFFVDDRNTARRSVQLELAEELGLPRAPIEAQLDDGSALALLWEADEERQRLFIEGSPTYVFDGGRTKLYGNFSEEVLGATVETLTRGLGPGCSSC